MESLKELIRGLMGIHLLGEASDGFSKPSNLRKTTGLLFMAVYGFHMAVGVLSLLVLTASFMSGHWLLAIALPLLGLLFVGLSTIPCWIFIDWEKNRLSAKKLNPQ